MKYLCLLALLGLVACAPTPDDTVPVDAISGGGGAVDLVEAETEECDAESYRSLLGTQVGATSFPASDRLRVFGQSDIVTQEYIPQRTNVVYNVAGQITRVFCG